MWQALPAWRRKFGDTFRFFVMTKEVVMIYKPEYIRKVFVSGNWPKGVLHTTLIPIVGEGLPFANGHLWQRGRKMMNPAFRPARLCQVALPHFVHHAQKLADRLRAMPHGAEIDVREEISKAALDIICAAGFGFQLESLDGRNTDFVAALSRVVAVSGQFCRFLPFGARIIRCLRHKDISTIDRVINEILGARARHRRSSSSAPSDKCQHVQTNLLSGKHHDMLDMLLDAGLSRQEVRDEIYTFLMAGYESTTLTLIWALYELAWHPDCLSKLLHELDVTRAALRFDNGVLSDDALRILSNMQCSAHVLDETMRRYPPVPVTCREVPASESVAIDGLGLRAGTMVAVDIYGKHHEEDVFSDPYTFRPDRWDGESHAPPTSFMPFTLGPRVCLGKQFFYMEAKVILLNILSVVTFGLPQNAARVQATTVSGTLRPEQPIRLRIQHRI